MQVGYPRVIETRLHGLVMGSWLLDPNLGFPVARDNRRGARKARISGLADRGKVRFPIKIKIGNRHYD